MTAEKHIFPQLSFGQSQMWVCPAALTAIRENRESDLNLCNAVSDSSKNEWGEESALTDIDVPPVRQRPGRATVYFCPSRQRRERRPIVGSVGIHRQPWMERRVAMCVPKSSDGCGADLGGIQRKNILLSKRQ
jgi:hypothetical protein